MNSFPIVRVVVGAIMVSLLFACSGSTFPADTNVTDTASATDTLTPDVVPTDATASDATDVVDGATPVDVQPPVDVAPMDAVVPADVILPVDVVNDVVVASDAGMPCVHDTDCVGTGLRCGYLIMDACAAMGTCTMTPRPLGCGAIILESGCGCDGTTVHWIGGCSPQYPAGYAPAPITHMGMCP